MDNGGDYTKLKYFGIDPSHGDSKFLLFKKEGDNSRFFLDTRLVRIELSEFSEELQDMDRRMRANYAYYVRGLVGADDAELKKTEEQYSAMMVIADKVKKSLRFGGNGSE